MAASTALTHTAEEVGPHTPPGKTARRPWLTPASVHVLTLAGSLAFWAWNDRKLWFFGDEWDFLVRRGLAFSPGSHRSIWFPHNEHWSTLPILLWRGLYSVFHLSSYWPYLAALLLAGTAVAHLVWRLAKQAGADPWVATFAAGLFAFLGAGAEDMTSAFQVSFVGSVLFGFIALVVLSGPATARRDWAVSLALLASLMCSTIGDAMVVGAAVVLAARRPARRALLVLALPVFSYVVWFAFLGRPSVSAPEDHFTLTTFTTVPSYVLFGLSGALGHSFGVPSAGPVLLIALATWVAWRAAKLWRQAPILLGLCAATLSFYVLAAVGRDQTAGAFIVVSRYVWVAMALLLPVIARALSPKAPVTQRPALRLAVSTFLVATAFANVGQAETWVAGRNAITSALRSQFVAVAHLLARDVPDVSGPTSSPIRLYPQLSAASIEGLARSGEVPTGPISPASVAEARELLAVGTWDGSRTALTTGPLFHGDFSLLRAIRSLISPAPGGCLQFDPERLPMQIWLSDRPAGRGASLELVAPKAPAGATYYVGATLVSPGQPVPAPVELAVPAAGSGYLSDNAPGTEVALSWDIGAPLVVCRLAGH